MVSSINSVRLWSQQAALAAFKDASNGSAAGGSSSSSSSSGSPTSLADVLFAGTSDSSSYEDPQLTALMTSLQQAMNGGAAANQTGDGSVDDMSSKAFMKALTDKIAALKASPDTATMADKMQQALDAGTLTLTNAVSGEKVTGWDPSKTTQTAGKTTTVAKTDWTTFLKDNLTRDASGKFVRNSDSSYIEKQTNASGYFGMVGDQYYYVSWTAPAATKPAVPAAPATPNTTTTG